MSVIHLDGVLKIVYNQVVRNTINTNYLLCFYLNDSHLELHSFVIFHHTFDNFLKTIDIFNNLLV